MESENPTPIGSMLIAKGALCTIYKKIWISCSHQIIHPSYKGKCSTLHGHNYKVEVWLTGKLGEIGMVLDFNLIKDIVNQYDHKHLNDEIGTTTPTAEVIAMIISKDILLVNPNINNRVRVWETESSYAEYWS
jgi:6-pyruvoyltetrahydropterin/6-carboxytetrahydropterin synthase